MRLATRRELAAFGVEPAPEARGPVAASAPAGRGGGGPRRPTTGSGGAAARRIRIVWRSWEEPDDDPVPIAGDRRRFSGDSAHQRREQPRRLRAVVPRVRSPPSPRPRLAARGLDGERLRAGREEGLANDRIVDQVEHVGGVAPEVGWRSAREPRCAAVARRSAGTADAERGSHCAGSPQSPRARRRGSRYRRVRRRRTAGRAANPSQRSVRVLEHRREQGLGRPANDEAASSARRAGGSRLLRGRAGRAPR